MWRRSDPQAHVWLVRSKQEACEPGSGPRSHVLGLEDASLKLDAFRMAGFVSFEEHSVLP